MAVYFCDSSAIVKCYVQERGSAWMAALLEVSGGHHLYVARITGVEVIAAISRRARCGDITPSDMAAAVAQFRQDFEGFTAASKSRIRDFLTSIPTVSLHFWSISTRRLTRYCFG